MEQSDHVITMNQCRILRQGPYTVVSGHESPAQRSETGADHGSPEQAPETVKSAHASAASQQDEIEQKIDDLVQSQGDTSLYKYYFKPVGWKYGIVALSLAASTEVFGIMRRMFQQHFISTQ